jgi:hypothetical protein
MCPSTAFAMQPVPSGINGEAWIQPIFVPTGSSEGNIDHATEVVTGKTSGSTAYATCRGWTSDDNGTGTGFTLRVTPSPPASYAGFGQALCSQPLPVACCRLP